MRGVIIDYGLGNVESVKKSFEYLKVETTITRDHDQINSADFIVLPGVGSFKQGMKNLDDFNLIDILSKNVLLDKKPFLGICLGMQLLATLGTEQGNEAGLNWIPGKVLPINATNLRVPHLGWNQLIVDNSNFFLDFHQRDFYFIHSFHFKLDDDKYLGASVNYGSNMVAAIHFENIYATQFHPEKSQEEGLLLIKKFIENVKS